MSRKVVPDSHVVPNNSNSTFLKWFPRSNSVSPDSHVPNNSSKVVPLNVLSEHQIKDINEKILVLNEKRKILYNNWRVGNEPINDNYNTKITDIDNEINELQNQIEESNNNKELEKYTRSSAGKLRKSKKIKKSKRKTRIRYKNRKSKKH